MRYGTSNSSSGADLLRNWASFACKLPNSLAIGDDEGGNAIIYAEGKNGFGVYAVSFSDLDADEIIFIAKCL